MLSFRAGRPTPAGGGPPKFSARRGLERHYPAAGSPSPLALRPACPHRTGPGSATPVVVDGEEIAAGESDPGALIRSALLAAGVSVHTGSRSTDQAFRIGRAGPDPRPPSIVTLPRPSELSSAANPTNGVTLAAVLAT